MVFPDEFRHCGMRPSCVWTNFSGICKDESGHRLNGCRCASLPVIFFQRRWVICWLQRMSVLVQLFSVSTSSSPSTSGDDGIKKYARPLGAIFVFLGIVVLAAGVSILHSLRLQLLRADGSQRHGTVLFNPVSTRQRDVPVARTIIAAIALGLCALVITAFGLLVAFKNQ